ncbi:lipopolysaccharide biosynthesis protein [Actinopolymorpha pittospori]
MSLQSPPRKPRRFQTLRDTSVLTVSSYGQYLIPLLTLPLIARTLGPHGFGYSALATATYFVGSIVVDAGISLPLAARLVTATHDETLLRRRYTRLRVLLFACFVLAAAGAYALAAPYSVKLAFLGAVAGGASSLHEQWVLVARRRFGRVAVSDWAGRLVNLAVLAAGLTLAPSAVWIPAGLCAGALTTNTVSRLLATANTAGAGAAAPDLAAMVRLGAPAVLGRLLVSAYGQAAPVLYAAVLTPGALGLYSASDRVVRAVQGLANPVSLAILPTVAEDRDRVAELAGTARRYTLYAMAAALLGSLGLALLAAPVAHVLYGEEFADTATILRVQAFLLPLGVGNTMVTSAFFNVIGDTRAVLLTSVAGLAATAAALGCTYLTGSLLVLAVGSIAAEGCAFATAWHRVARTVRRLEGT